MLRSMVHDNSIQRKLSIRRSVQNTFVFTIIVLFSQQGCLDAPENRNIFSIPTAYLASSPAATFILTEEGQLFVAGSNVSGNLGIGHPTKYPYSSELYPITRGIPNILDPTINTALPPISYIQNNTEISNDMLAGYPIPTQGHTIIIDNNGTLWSTGVNKSNGVIGADLFSSHLFRPLLVQNKLSQNMQFTQISSNSMYTVAIDSHGQLWGTGQRGFSSTEPFASPFGSNEQLSSYYPQTIRQFTPVNVIDSTNQQAVKFKRAAACIQHAVYLDTNGYIWIAGSNNSLQLGSLSALNILDTNQISEITRRDIYEDGQVVMFQDVSCSLQGTLLLDVNGHIWFAGNTGLSSYSATNVPFTPDFTRIPVLRKKQDLPIAKAILTQKNSYVLTMNGSLFVAGDVSAGTYDTTMYPHVNSSNILEDYTEIPLFSTDGVLLIITDFTASSTHLMVKDNSNRLWSIGNNLYGQLSIGQQNTLSYFTSPEPVIHSTKTLISLEAFE